MIIIMIGNDNENDVNVNNDMIMITGTKNLSKSSLGYYNYISHNVIISFKFSLLLIDKHTSSVFD